MLQAKRLRFLTMGLALAVAGVAHAQDQRKVAEPVIPTSCAKIQANLVAPGNKLGITDEARPDTQRLQTLFDGFAKNCQPGTAIELAPGAKGANAYLSGPLELREGVTLLIDKGVTLFASRRAADYDTSPRSCGVLQASASAESLPAKRARPCKPFLSIRAKNVAIMGEGVIDGRGGAKLLDKPYSWWGLAVMAEKGNKPYGDPRLIDASGADGLVLYKITLHNSPNFHVGVTETNGFTAWDVHIKTPTVPPGPNDPRPRNTDGIDPGASQNITIAHSWIDNGDDNIAIKTGVGYVSVLDNHFYNGHGMSIGSDTYSGVHNLFVDGLTEDHTTSGIRIKSNVTRGGQVNQLLYRGVCMRDVPVPIAITPYYNNGTTEEFRDPGLKGDRIPDYRLITLSHVHAETPGEVMIAGYDDKHRTEVTLIDVVVKDSTPDKLHLKLADLAVRRTNLPLEKAAEGNDVKITQEDPVGIGEISCDQAFVPMR